LKLKNKLYLTQILIILTFIIFICSLYITFKKHSEQNLESQLTKSVNLTKQLLRSTLEGTYKTFDQRKSFIKYMHRIALEEFKKNENISLEELKSRIITLFDLKDLDIDLFLIDKNYVIIDATFEKDIGLDFKQMPDAKADLDKATKDNAIHIGSNISIDYMDSNIKMYSCARTSNNQYLELAFIDSFIYDKLRQSISDISENTKVKIKIFRITKTSSGKEFYEDIMNNQNIINKQEWYDSQKNFSLNATTHDEIINVYRQNKIFKTTKNMQDSTATIYVPLHTKGNDNSLGDNHFVLKLQIDISDEMAQWEENKNIFYVISLALILLMILLYYFIKHHFYTPITTITQNFEEKTNIADPNLLNKKDEFGILSEKYNTLYSKLQDQIENNLHLLNENKQFIADMVHQIRTPLSVIMTNTSLIEMSSEQKVSSYITQINAAINMLSNSYEDLSYIISNDVIEYKPLELDFTNFLHERINFFEVIANANNKTISTDIANDIKITINDTELERLIDNNLSNAIKHSNDNSVIKVILKKVHSEIILQFISEGKNIHNVFRVFDKNYTESSDAKRSLGLGLYMVKSICEKNDIEYTVNSINNMNTFTYIFKV